MSSFNLEMQVDNACFEGEDLAGSIADALQNLAERIKEQSRDYLAGNGSRMVIRDANGNGIGFAHFEIDKEENN